MESQDTINLRVDGQDVAVPAGTTILEAARQIGIHIPTLCHHPALSAYGGCRLCVVEVDEAPRLLASCVTPARRGMSVVTCNQKILESRRTVIEFLFSERTHQCMYCAKSGDCELQSLAYEHQLDSLTAPPLEKVYAVDVSHGDIAIDHNRCVLCGRCIRACRELAGQSVLDFHNRGVDVVIGVDLSEGIGQSTCISCGVCVQVCPTGAIFNRLRTHYAVSGKSRNWRKIDSVCTECEFLCPIVCWLKDSNLIKIESRLDGSDPVTGVLCRRGRTRPFMSPGRRLTGPLFRDNGSWGEMSMDEALTSANEHLTALRRKYGKEAVVGLVSSRCCNEELAAFKTFMRLAFEGAKIDALDGHHLRNRMAIENEADALSSEMLASLIDAADLVLAIGIQTETHPVVHGLLRRAWREKGLKVGSIGSSSSSEENADRHLKVNGQDLAGVVQAFRKQADPLGSEVLPPELSARIDGAVYDRLQQWWKQSRRPLVLAGTELTGMETPDGLAQALELARLKIDPAGESPRLVFLNPSSNSAGARALGLVHPEDPFRNLRVRGAVICLAGEADVSPRLLDPLKGLEYAAVFTPWRPARDLAPAGVMIPIAAPLEAGGSHTTPDGKGTRARCVILEPLQGVRPMVDVLKQALSSFGSDPGEWNRTR